MPEPPFVEFDEKDSLMRLGISIIALLAFFFPLICETKYSLDEKHINVNVGIKLGIELKVIIQIKILITGAHGDAWCVIWAQYHKLAH